MSIILYVIGALHFVAAALGAIFLMDGSPVPVILALGVGGSTIGIVALVLSGVIFIAFGRQLATLAAIEQALAALNHNLNGIRLRDRP